MEYYEWPQLRVRGLSFQVGDGASPEDFNNVGEVMGITGLRSGTAAEIDVTNLSSVARFFWRASRPWKRPPLLTRGLSARAQRSLCRSGRARRHGIRARPCRCSPRHPVPSGGAGGRQQQLLPQPYPPDPAEPDARALPQVRARCTTIRTARSRSSTGRAASPATTATATRWMLTFWPPDAAG
jgi:hypothetical protein